MYKRLLNHYISPEAEEEFFEMNQTLVRQQFHAESFNCNICKSEFEKTDYHLQEHINSAIHKKLAKQFTIRYNKIIKLYRKSIYKTRLGRNRKKLLFYEQLYQFE
ncbi:hypothetical protein pb186bvf_007491 [Paramecium bursaria]